MSFLRSAWATAALIALILSLLGCARLPLAVRLARAARPLDCRTDRGVPVPCPQEWP